MEFVKEAYLIFGGMAGPASFGQFCQACDEEITGLDPMYYEADGDMDSDGTRDCSTYLCQPCGAKREADAVEEAARRSAEIERGPFKDS